MDPRLHRYRYQSTASFLHYLQMSTKLQPHDWESHSSTTSSPVRIHINHSHTVSLVRRKGAPNGSIGTDSTSSHSKHQQNGNLKLSCILLSATAHEVRTEVDTLVSDLVVRLKQLLFNSLLCAYYTGFIPMQFVDVGHLVSNYCVIVMITGTNCCVIINLRFSGKYSEAISIIFKQ